MDIESMLWGGIVTLLLAAYLKPRPKVSTSQPPAKKIVRADEVHLKRAAYHEAAHATVALRLMPRRIHEAVLMAEVEIEPDADTAQFRHHVRVYGDDMAASSRRAMIAFLYAGLCGEEIIYGDCTTDCQEDIDNATRIAIEHVNAFALKDESTPVSYSVMTEKLGCDERTMRRVVGEVKKICHDERERAKQILKEDDKVFRAIAEELLKRKRLSGDELWGLALRHIADGLAHAV